MKKRIKALLLAVCLITALPSSLRGNDMEAEAASRQLNLVVTHGTSMTVQYGVPNAFIARFNSVTTKVRNKYMYNFGISLNFSKPATNYVVTGDGDACRRETNIFSSLCQHAPSTSCRNSGPYHHTNCEYIKDGVFPRPRPFVNGVEVYMVSHQLCYVADTGYHQDNIFGMTYPGLMTMVVRDYDYSMVSNVNNWMGDTSHIDYISKTLAHEIGHLYGIEDHYDIIFGTDRDNCIWGFNKGDSTVTSGLIMCNACRSVIMENRDWYNMS